MKFTIKDLWLTTFCFAFAAVSFGTSALRLQPLLGTVALLLVGWAISGPVLLVWFWKTKRLVGRWGVGEQAWAVLGGLFWLLIVTEWLSFGLMPSQWLFAGAVVSGLIFVASFTITLASLLAQFAGHSIPLGSERFGLRPTNVAGLLLVLIFLLLGMGYQYLENL